MIVQKRYEEMDLPITKKQFYRYLNRKRSSNYKILMSYVYR